MKVTIDRSEWYPVHSAAKDPSGIEVPDEMFHRWEKINADFDAMQEEMAEVDERDTNRRAEEYKRQQRISESIRFTLKDPSNILPVAKQDWNLLKLKPSHAPKTNFPLEQLGLGNASYCESECGRMFVVVRDGDKCSNFEIVKQA